MHAGSDNLVAYIYITLHLYRIACMILCKTVQWDGTTQRIYNNLVKVNFAFAFRGYSNIKYVNIVVISSILCGALLNMQVVWAMCARASPVALPPRHVDLYVYSKRVRMARAFNINHDGVKRV